MEFKFNINDIFKHPFVAINNTLVPPGFSGDKRALWDTQSKVSQVVNAIGEASAAAQGLTKPITTAERLRNSEHRLYLLIDKEANDGKGAVTGLLKTGEKGLYVFDREGHHYQVSPPCVLDFYIHESRQRTGLGKRLFEHMLEAEKTNPVKLAIDRPSEKFLAFLNKYYNLNTPVKQMNNFVVFDGFFHKPTEPIAVEPDPSPSPRTPSKKQSANGLQLFSSPYGRYAAPRPHCSMGQIIHNDTSVVNKGLHEPSGIRSAPATNLPNQIISQTPYMNYTQSTPNMQYGQAQPVPFQSAQYNLPMTQSQANTRQPDNNYNQQMSRVPILNTNPQHIDPSTNISQRQINVANQHTNNQHTSNMNMLNQQVLSNQQTQGGLPQATHLQATESNFQNPTIQQEAYPNNIPIPNRYPPTHSGINQNMQYGLSQQLLTSPTQERPLNMQSNANHYSDNGNHQNQGINYNQSQMQTMIDQNIQMLNKHDHTIPYSGTIQSGTRYQQVDTTNTPATNNRESVTQMVPHNINQNLHLTNNVQEARFAGNNNNNYNNNQFLSNTTASSTQLANNTNNINLQSQIPVQQTSISDHKNIHEQGPQVNQHLVTENVSPNVQQVINNPVHTNVNGTTNPNYNGQDMLNMPHPGPYGDIQNNSIKAPQDHQNLQNYQQPPNPTTVSQAQEHYQNPVSYNQVHHVPSAPVQLNPQPIQYNISTSNPSQQHIPQTNNPTGNIGNINGYSQNTFAPPYQGDSQYISQHNITKTPSNIYYQNNIQQAQNNAQRTNIGNVPTPEKNQMPLPDEGALGQNYYTQGNNGPYPEEGLTHGYPPQFSPQDLQANSSGSENHSIDGLAKLDRPRSLSIQVEESAEDKHKNNLVTALDASDKAVHEIENELEKIDDVVDGIEKAVEKIHVDIENAQITLENIPKDVKSEKNTPSHLTGQGFFDLKFYHNKLW